MDEEKVEAEGSFQEKIMTVIASIRNELERIEMHSETNECGGPDYDTIEVIADLIEGSLLDIRELVGDALKEAEG